MSYKGNDPFKNGPAGNPYDREWSSAAASILEEVVKSRKEKIRDGKYPYKYNWSWITSELNNKLLSSKALSSEEYAEIVAYPFTPEEVEWHCFQQKALFEPILGHKIKGTKLAVDKEGHPKSSWWPPLEKESFQEALLETFGLARNLISKTQYEDSENAHKALATEKFMTICKDIMVLKAAGAGLPWERVYDVKMLIEEFESWKEWYWSFEDGEVKRLETMFLLPEKGS